ncbi:MAG: response regulator [Bacilli bacterium]|nr:response regulator [Bacilli bacterium]
MSKLPNHASGVDFLSSITLFAEMIPGGFFVYEATGEEKLVYINKTAMRIYGCETREEFARLTGDTFPGMVHPDDYEGIEKSIQDQIHVSDESLDHLEFRAIKKNGDIAYITDFGRFVEHPDLGPLFFVFIEDITSVAKSAENKMLKDALEEKEKLMDTRKDFLSNMSHDMRTPLNGVIGMSEFAMKKTDNPEVTSCLEKIVSSGKSLRALINDAFDLSEVESGNFAILEGPINLLTGLSYVNNSVQSEISEKHLRYSFDTAEVIHPYVLIDHVRLSQILMNFLSNACKYTPRGGEVTLKISQKSSAKPGYVDTKFEVIDNGIGISDEFKPRLFDAFEREDHRRIGKVSGSGLGLTLCRELTHAMGGKIGFTSEKNIGSNFFIEFTLKILEKQDLKEGELSDLDLDLSSQKILIAEDQFINQEILKEMLLELGAESIVANDGLEALEDFSSSKPGDFDLILTDIKMPRMDGIELSKSIRNLSRADAKKIPIIAVTANDIDNEKDVYKEAGIDGLIPKPVDMTMLKYTLFQYQKK